MSVWLQVACGLLLGALAALWHLGVTARRARWAVAGRVRLALASLPLGLAGPALAILAAARLDPLIAWCTVPALALTRAVVLGRAKEA